MVRNEKTSKRVASIAAKVMTFEGLRGLHGKATLFTCGSSGEYNNTGVTVAEVRALAASCLTQSADKAELQRLRSRLELTHVYRFTGGKMTRVKLKPGEAKIPDGIACRDETIRLLDQRVEELQRQLKAPPKSKLTNALDVVSRPLTARKNRSPSRSPFYPAATPKRRSP